MRRLTVILFWVVSISCAATGVTPPREAAATAPVPTEERKPLRLIAGE
jgi:hypothetical protein